MQMKKNRPAVKITVIGLPEVGETLADVLLRETSTLGVRLQEMQRRKAGRSYERIDTPLGSIAVKVKRLGTRIISASPEYEDCQRIALERNVPLVEVYELAQRTIQSTIIGV